KYLHLLPSVGECPLAEKFPRHPQPFGYPLAQMNTLPNCDSSDSSHYVGRIPLRNVQPKHAAGSQLRTIDFFFVFFALFCGNSRLLPAATNAVASEKVPFEENYTKYEYRIPMRDGVKLFTIVYRPKDTSTNYPILLQRTPYNLKPYTIDVGRKPGGIPDSY